LGSRCTCENLPSPYSLFTGGIPGFYAVQEQALDQCSVLTAEDKRGGTQRTRDIGLEEFANWR